MKPSEKADSGLNRRDLLKSSAAALALTAGVGIPGLAVAAEPSSANPIVKENAKPGTRDWMLTKTDVADTGWVSFDRPYSQFCQDHLVRNPKSIGSGEFLLWEFPLPCSQTQS